MRDFGTVSSRFWVRGSGLLAKDAPNYWIDHLGRVWKVPTIIGRLKPGKLPGHRALRDFVLRRARFACECCGYEGDDHNSLVADHIVSRRNGGAHHPDNLQCLCQSCNSRKAGLVDAKGAR